MSFDLFSDVYVKNPDTPTQLAGCSVLLIYRDSKINRSNARTFKYGLGGNGLETASLISMRLALSSIKPSFRKSHVNLYINSEMWPHYAAAGDIASKTKWHKQCADSLFRWISYYENLKIMADEKCEHADILRELSKSGCESQTTGDSGTVHWG